MTEGIINPSFWRNKWLLAATDGVRIFKNPDLTEPLGITFKKGHFVGQSVELVPSRPGFPGAYQIKDYPPTPPYARYTVAYVSLDDVQESNYDPDDRGPRDYSVSISNLVDTQVQGTSAKSTAKIPLLWWAAGGAALLMVGAWAFVTWWEKD